MTAALVLAAGTLVLGLASVLELLRSHSDRRASGDAPATGGPERLAETLLEGVAIRLALAPRLSRAGLADRVSVRALLIAKLGGSLAGGLWALIAAPAAPGRLAAVVAAGLPVAGFLGPDAWLERRARRRLRALRAGLPDALDLLAVSTAAGRSPLASLSELGAGEGPLARELAALAAESSCGIPQSEALDSLRRRAPVGEVAAMCGVIERSRRYGSPLADQLREQASALRGVQRRQIEERAARAAPKIQLAVALLLVPSVLLMIAAGLLANVDRFLAGF
jgi:tight adherence protein C